MLGRLGVPEGKTTVLYAPTYRDNLTTRTYAAKRFDELDLVEMTRALGPDVVVLLRGHNNNQRELDRVLSIPNVVDVTDYPEINELTVAADVAILDYSSLRFEWALTGKPVLFFVPDVDSYFASRPPLFDYAGTAPGPWLSTTAEVVDKLRDLDAAHRRSTRLRSRSSTPASTSCRTARRRIASSRRSSAEPSQPASGCGDRSVRHRGRCAAWGSSGWPAPQLTLDALLGGLHLAEQRVTRDRLGCQVERGVAALEVVEPLLAPARRSRPRRRSRSTPTTPPRRS